MASILFAEEQLEIPLEIGTLAEFRRWALSPEFPERGRIDFIDGTINVDLAPENIFYHGTIKVDCVAEIVHRVDELQLGHVLCSRSRVSNVGANLSVEPDILVITNESIDTRRIRLVPDGSGVSDSYVEIEGSPDLVVEILSDGSEHKDKKRLSKAYYRAGVREYWLVDVRGDKLMLQILCRGRERFEASPVDDDGFQPSEVLQCRYTLNRQRGPGGFWQFALVRG
jgi:Uma2 family endonuclease